MRNLIPFLLILSACTHGAKTNDPNPEPTPTATHSPYLVDSSELFGVTIDSIDNLPAIVDALGRLPKRITARIVFDAQNSPAYYKDAVAKIGMVADILGQPSDSEYVKGLSLAAYKKRFQDYVAAFPQIQMWETGNEINGDWLGTGVVAKFEAAHDVVRGAGKKTVLVPYWNSKTCADSNGYWLDWLKKNMTAKLKSSDYVLVSVYGWDCDGPEPTKAEITDFYTELGVMFPNAMLGIGEMGGSEKYSVAKRAATIPYYYNMPKLHPRDVGFNGFWFFTPDAVPYTKSTWTKLNEVLK